jgi:hypothetical protein
VGRVARSQRNAKDIFVEADYLSNLDGSAGTYLHSHLPKQAAVDAVGSAFAAQGINPLDQPTFEHFSPSESSPSN